jgi:uncharacterized membrane protein YdbT with pleckstrin-like domain
VSGPARKPVDQACAWIYEGVWAAITALFKVPRHGPSLPVSSGETIRQFHPAKGYLGYLKFWFWLLLLLADGLVLLLGLVFYLTSNSVGLAVMVGLLVLAVLPDVIAYVAIHLRYDTMWYVLTERSLQIRRGVWVIHETTITFENVQNVGVRSGPVQRLFGIADVTVETAGSAGQTAEGHAGHSVTNRGLVEGVSNATEIRDLIMARARRTTSAGLGDEDPAEQPAQVRLPRWSPGHLALLREIRDLVVRRAVGS